ncbi:2'-5' RNA ligase family protein [Sphingobacterium oryzagri]|uniref:2'-5' RNA ligase family protein n=1 Tax=Sphingobacterium oryzagri TaxID=3025669 RepID=A0ABY7WG24_9SPHI|nr:2'-5' RNA ligase family protein [Sphingobacterium sp. KACC 22765]WDF67569.1 2'-5' RNA ligase family protein [Sphingobacterium sp. KACC 22765]
MENEALNRHYAKLYAHALEKFSTDDYEIDTQLADPTDTRFGITLVIRPDQATKDRISAFLQALQTIEPSQYFYRQSDMHITVMSIISCYADFALDTIYLPDYQSLIEKSLARIPPFQISFRGITASPSCVLIQGFFQDDSLNDFRNNLRDNFRASGLEHSIDQRYTIRTAHATVCRLTHPLTHKPAFLALLEKYRDHDFGTFTVDRIELVANDWYQRHEKVHLLHTFSLPQHG